MKNSLIVARNESRVIGVLSGWDRVVFRGCCPLFAFVDGMLKWLLHMGIWLTDYSKWALAMSDAMKRACLHVYKYWLDGEFGLMGARLQTWLPYGVQVWINGREWLARKLDRKGIAYRRDGNCFPWIENFDTAQKLMNQTHRKNWIRVLDRILARLCPGYRNRLDHCDVYWTAFQTEWARDICFDSTDTLRAIYHPLIRGAMTALGCDDILRFMNKRRSFQGEVDSNCRKYPEGVRVKHHLGGNTVKAYDKAGSVLRIETTINQPRQFRVFRTKQGDPEGVAAVTQERGRPASPGRSFRASERSLRRGARLTRHHDAAWRTGCSEPTGSSAK